MNFSRRILLNSFLFFFSQAAFALKTEKINLLGKGIFTEGIAYSEKYKKHFIGSAVGGSIQTVDEKGLAVWLQKDGADGRSKTLGIQVDDSRDRLWVLGNDSIYLYDLKSNALIKKIPAGALGAAFLNDLVLDSGGSAYITDSMAPNLFKVDGKKLSIKKFRDMKDVNYGSVNGSPWNLNGIVLSPDKKSLIVGKTNDGTMWLINISSKKLAKLQLSKEVTNADGLTWGPGNTLFIVRNFKNTISKINFDPKARVQRVEDLDIDERDLLIPTTTVYHGGAKPYLLVVNSQFEQSPSAFFLTKVFLD